MNEQVSALTDDEVAAEDVEHIITVMQSNKQAAEAWSHYHLIGDVMRGAANPDSLKLNTDEVFGLNFKHKLMQKIELEPTVLSPNAALAHHQNATPSEQQHSRKMPVVWSVAASFAAVLMVGWMVLHQQAQTGQALAPVEVALNSSSEKTVPTEYLMAHQASAPSASSYYIQSVGYSE